MQGLRRAFDRGGVHLPGERLRDALRHVDQGEHQADRHHDVEPRPGQVDPEVADGADLLPGEPAHQRYGDRQAGGGGDEVLPGEAGHLDQMARTRLARVGLPVRVRDEADRGVERQIGGHPGRAGRVERQDALEPEQKVQDREAREVEEEQRDRVDGPRHLGVRIDAGNPVHDALHRREDRSEPRLLAREHLRHVETQGIADPEQHDAVPDQPGYVESHGTVLPLRTSRGTGGRSRGRQGCLPRSDPRRRTRPLRSPSPYSLSAARTYSRHRPRNTNTMP